MRCTYPTPLAWPAMGLINKLYQQHLMTSAERDARSLPGELQYYGTYITKVSTPESKGAQGKTAIPSMVGAVRMSKGS